MLICFFTIDEILGSAGLKDMTKGVLSVFVAFCSCGCSGYISCNSKNLIYLIQCKKCHSQYIGETKRKLNERSGSIADLS